MSNIEIWLLLLTISLGLLTVVVYRILLMLEKLDKNG